MERSLPDHIRNLEPDPRIRDLVRACGASGGTPPVHSNDVIGSLRTIFRDLLQEDLTISHATVVADVLATKLYPDKTVKSPDRMEYRDSWSESRMVRDWWWQDNQARGGGDSQWAEEVGIFSLMLHVRSYDDDVDVVRGASFVLDRLAELRPRPTSPFDDENPYRTA